MNRDRRGKKPWYRRRIFWWPTGVIVGVLVALIVTFIVSPWPAALILRAKIGSDNGQAKQAMQKHVPSGIHRIEDVQYRPDDSEARLDVYYPDDGGTDLPVIIWTHGGGWISGSKDNGSPYYRILASRGFTVVAVDYSYGPEHTYPTAVHQLNDAFGFLNKHADRFHADPDRIILAGDSAGAQITSQMAAAVTSPDYADTLGITPALHSKQLRGTVLACGIYDMDRLASGSSGARWGFDVAMWAYTGSRDYDDDPALAELSTINYLTPDFPPTFITGGNADALTDQQSKPFASRLKQLDVDTRTLFFPSDYTPALGHEYQFNLDIAAGKKALHEIVAFSRDHTRSNK